MNFPLSGAAGFEAYKAGAVKLEDFVGVKSDPRWGTMHYAKSLREVLGEDGARKYRIKSLPMLRKP